MENKCQICIQDFQNCICKKKGKKIIILIIVLLVLYLSITNAIKMYASYTNPRTITVSGKAEISAVPDISTLSFTVRSSGTNPDTEKMQSDIAVIVTSVFSKLKDLGIEEKDIKTTNYSVNPKYGSQDCSSKVQTMIYPPRPCSTSVVSGYEASESVNVKVRDTKNVAKVLAALAELKITEISGPNFEIDSIDKLKDEAREKAIIDAREKAKVLGKSLKINLKKIVSFSDDSANAYPMMYGKAMSMMDSSLESSLPNIAAGEQKITSNVSITFEIQD